LLFLKHSDLYVECGEIKRGAVSCSERLSDNRGYKAKWNGIIAYLVS
jgi:hypothetical protein